jgi:hypothetical protein
MVSRDGAASWSTLDEKPMEIPVVADEGGNAQQIILPDEFESHTWLSNLLAKDGKLHFLYMAQTKPAREHYVRYDIRSGKEDLRIQPTFCGEKISLMGLSGFFAARSSLPNGPLYCVSRFGRRIGCLASDDNGKTWYDYAVSPEITNSYSIGGARELTADGHIIGSFTDQLASTSEPTDSAHVYFFRIQAGLSRARLAAVHSAGGKTILRFADVCGQPEQIRLHTAPKNWSPWIKFQERVTVTGRPTAYQLKSRVGVISQSFAVKNPG